MKTAVSIPDDIYEAAERIARRRGIPRSQLYAEALERVVSEESEDEVTAQLDRVYAESGGDDPEARAATEFRREAARRALRRLDA